VICSCGRLMDCTDSRPYDRNPKIVRLRLYRCACGLEEGTTEVRHNLAVIKHAINRERKGRRRIIVVGRGVLCRS